MMLGLASSICIAFLTSCANSLDIRFGPDVSPSLQTQLHGFFPTPAPSNLTIEIGRDSEDLVSLSELKNLADDGFIVRSRNHSNGTLVAVMGGNPRALSYGAFYLLRLLGVDFLHPMHVTRNSHVEWSAISISKVREPKLLVRGSHIHAEHPNELCSMLNGFDANGSYDRRASWEKLLPEWDAYLRWLIANGQNYIDWSLLSAHVYEDFSESVERQARLKILVSKAKNWNLTVGIDATFSQTQEHGFRLWRTTHKREEDDWYEIQQRVEWLLNAGFDYIHSELGTSELTEGSNTTRLMVLLNRTASFMASRGSQLWLENHISGGQAIEGFPDPLDPSQDINFNWMTYYLDRSIISRPHTVQAYSLIDPAPVYNGNNFSATLDFVELMLTHGRSIVYYPETAYWCNYDNSVPLFLPVYALSRITDLQLLREVEARAKRRGGIGLRGQFVWESGWAWGYWLPTVVAVRSHWIDISPADRLKAADQSPQILSDILTDVFRSFTHSVEDAIRLADAIRNIAVSQRELFILGQVTGKHPPREVEKANAFAYLIGNDAIADLLQVLHDNGIRNMTTQPHRLPYRKLRHDDNHGSALREYKTVVRPLLSAVTNRLELLGSDLNAALQSLLQHHPDNPLLLDLRDSMALLQLRSRQVEGLYAYASCAREDTSRNCSDSLSRAQDALNAAAPLVRAQENRYGLFAVGSERLWAYGHAANPTGYGRGQYWTVHSLYYWRRDQNIVTDDVTSPCFMNINDPLELYLGDGAERFQEEIEVILKRLLHDLPLVRDISDCLAPVRERPSVLYV